uniref:Uncharacterized protein n=1 Tax=Anguilla anguilla TaxID=7936 RepID=A0A0E9WD66_ANGAN
MRILSKNISQLISPNLRTFVADIYQNTSLSFCSLLNKLNECNWLLGNASIVSKLN